MRLYSLVDLTGNVNITEKLVLGRTGTGDLPTVSLKTDSTDSTDSTAAATAPDPSIDSTGSVDRQHPFRRSTAPQTQQPVDRQHHQCDRNADCNNSQRVVIYVYFKYIDYVVTNIKNIQKYFSCCHS